MKLFLDDLRHAPEGYDLHAFNAPAAIAVLQTGLVTHISFDHDLGDDVKGTGYTVACYIETAAVMGSLPKLTWETHSMNPVGAARIRQAMTVADKIWSST